MTPIYGRSSWHDPRANVVPPRATLPFLWHGRHDPLLVVVPPFEVFLLCKNAGWHDGTTARPFDNFLGDVGKSLKKRWKCEIHTSQQVYRKTVVPSCHPPQHPAHIWGYQEANELTHNT